MASDKVCLAVIGVDRNVGRIAVREPRAYERFDMICDLLAYKGAASNADLSGIRKRIVECDEMRNILAHSTWVRDPIHDAFRLVKTTGQWQPTPSHPPKIKRKVHPEAVLFEAPEAVALNDKLRLLLKEIEQWAAEFQLP